MVHGDVFGYDGVYRGGVRCGWDARESGGVASEGAIWVLYDAHMSVRIRDWRWFGHYSKSCVVYVFTSVFFDFIGNKKIGIKYFNLFYPVKLG